MIRELMYELYSNIRLLIGSGAVVVLFIASLIFVFRDRTDNDGDADHDPCPALFFSPLVLIGCAVSLMFSKVTDTFKNPLAKRAALVFAACLAALIIASSGTFVFSNDLSGRAENDMHIPSDLIGAMDAVLADDGAAKVLTMPGWGAYLSAYSSSFTLMYEDPEGEDLSGLDEDSRIVYRQLLTTHPDMKAVASAAKRAKVSHIILSDSLWPEVPITKFGYEPALEEGGCIVYREVKAP